MGVNTWDLMDKSRDSGSRPEIQRRLDAMVQAGWSVGRTWGFSLGGGVSNGPLGNVIADPTKILETAPGARWRWAICMSCSIAENHLGLLQWRVLFYGFYCSCQCMQRIL